jgi:hypothetical protein
MKTFLAGPLAVLDGLIPAVPSAPRSPVPIVGSNSTLPVFSPDDKSKFVKIFVGAGPVNGLLSGACKVYCHSLASILNVLFQVIRHGICL